MKKLLIIWSTLEDYEKSTQIRDEARSKGYRVQIKNANTFESVVKCDLFYSEDEEIIKAHKGIKKFPVRKKKDVTSDND